MITLMGVDWLTILSAAALVVSVLLLVAMVAARRRPDRHEAREVPPPAGRSSPAEEYASVQAVVRMEGVGERLQELEQQLCLLAERQDQLDLRQPVERSYRLAIKLARGGAAVEELVANCGINRGEAELIAMLHRAPTSGPV